MKNFARVPGQFDPTEALAQLDANPSLWGRNPERIAVEGSPHAQSQDIWVRFRDPSVLHEPADYGAPHWAVWYPAWHVLTALHPVVFALASDVRATYIGGILITRIPAGAAILPHIDRGWHPDTMDTKAYLVLRANEDCINRCGDEAVIMRPGEAWVFRNDITHSVENHGETERIAVIVTMRTT